MEISFPMAGMVVGWLVGGGVKSKRKRRGWFGCVVPGGGKAVTDGCMAGPPRHIPARKVKVKAGEGRGSHGGGRYLG